MISLLCSGCGSKLKEGDKFCAACGKSADSTAVRVVTDPSESALTYGMKTSKPSSAEYDDAWRSKVESIVDQAVHNVDELIGDMETPVKFGRLIKPEYAYYLGYVEGVIAERIIRILIENGRTSQHDERWLKAIYDNRKSYEILKAVEKSEKVKILIKKSHVV